MPAPQIFDAGPNGGDGVLSKLDLNRTPLGGNPYAPDPTDHTLDGGQVLYHMAFGAQPEDFHPNLRPLAQGYSLLFQPKPALGPGLLGSADDIRQALATPSAGPTPETEGPDISAYAGPAGLEDVAARLRQRDIDYLDRYYDAVSKYAGQHKVNPAFPLGLGIESAFASDGTYLKTGDAFGMTGGTTARMTQASSPEENARRLFDLYGRQMYGVGDDAEAFVNAMQGRNAKGQAVPGWRVYNSKYPKKWEKTARDGVSQMQRDLPIYLPTRKSKIGATP